MKGVIVLHGCRLALSLLLVTAITACDDDPPTEPDAGGFGGASGMVAGAGGTRDAATVDGSGGAGGGAGAPAAGCYPSCVEALRIQCPFMTGETCAQQQLAVDAGAMTARCYSAGIKETDYPETLPEGVYSTTRRTLRDGRTTCFLQSQATMAMRPFRIVRDGQGNRVATIEPTADPNKATVTCLVSGETRVVDLTNPACSMTNRPSCQAGICAP